MKLLIEVEVTGTGDERVLDAISDWCWYYGKADLKRKTAKAEALTDIEKLEGAK